MGGRALVLDAAGFPASWRIQLHVSSGQKPQYVVITSEGIRVPDNEVAGVWWRRPKDHEIPDAVQDANHRAFCRAESRALFEGWAYSLGRKVINPLEKELAARKKPYQLAVASRLGLALPKTLVTNDPSGVEEMTAAGGNYIYKILTNTPWQFTETRALGSAETKQLSLLRVAPVIFQERIDGGPDIRVTIVDDEVFPVELQASHPEAWLDWRMDLAVEIRPHVLPPQVAQKLVDFERAMGLRYGALDLRLSASGEYVFFEVNPAGQYLFAEIYGAVPISRRLAWALLAGPPEDRAQPGTRSS